MNIKAIRMRAGLRESLVDQISEAEAETAEHERHVAECRQREIELKALLKAFDQATEAEDMR